MGCFLGCFGSSKDRKQRKQKYKTIRADQNPKSQNLVQDGVSLVQTIKYPKSQTLVQDDASLLQTIKDKPSNPVQELCEKIEEPLNLSNKKKVTFDTNITTFEHVQENCNSTEYLLERNEKVEAFPKSRQIGSNEKCSDVNNVGPYPPNYRYGNCLESDDEVEDSDSEDEKKDNLEDDIEQDYDNEADIICEEVWCESIPVETESSLNPVLKPVENLTQWKALKSKGTITQSPSPQKENSLTSVPFPQKNRNQEPSVDACLSNWLVSSEKNPSNNKRVGSYNPDHEPFSQESPTTTKSIEDRPILGALTVDELKKFSESTCTPRKSPGRNPDDIIGSVGSSWSQTGSSQSFTSFSSYKGIPNTTSKYREDKKVNWHNTPFETRLERALNREAAK